MKIIGHRGARGLAPENTLTALQKGLQHHVDALEFDLRVTKDSIVILHHDPYLTDPNGQRRVIAEHTYRELLAHKPNLATFKQVLETISHPVQLYVEVKPDVTLKPIIDIIKTYLKKDWQADNLRLASYSQKTLLHLHAELPEIQKIVIEKWSGVRATFRARQLGTKYISMNQKWLWWGFIQSVTDSGYRLYTYPLNDPAKARRWANYGLYGTITDYPDRFERR